MSKLISCHRICRGTRALCRGEPGEQIRDSLVKNSYLKLGSGRDENVCWKMLLNTPVKVPRKSFTNCSLDSDANFSEISVAS